MKNIPISLISRYRNEIYGAAALWVVGLHAVNLFQIDITFGLSLLKPIEFIVSQDLAVDVFLILSGMSCYYSYSARPDAGSFFRRRITRIWPALLFTYGISWIVLALFGKIAPLQSLYNLSLMPFFFEGNANGAWYFSFIMLMYISFPYIYELTFRYNVNIKYVTIKTSILFSCILLLYWLLHKYALPAFLNIEIGVARIPVFIIGCYLGYLSKGNHSCSGYLLIVSIPFVFLWAELYYAFVVPHHFWWGRLFYSLGGGVISVAVLTSFFYCLEKFAASVGSGLKKACLAIGSCSLELYGSHLVLFYGMIPLIPALVIGNAIQFLVYLLLSVAYSLICVRVLEPGFLRSVRVIMHLRIN